MRGSRGFACAVTGFVVAAATLAVFAACGTELTLLPSDADADGSLVDATLTDGTDLDGAQPDGGRGDAEAGPLRCGHPQRCSGTVRIDQTFSAVPGDWFFVGADQPVLDDAVYISPPSSLRATAPTSQAGGLLGIDLDGGVRSVCIELCALVDYDTDEFGDAGVDYVQLVALGLQQAGGGRAGGFSVGIARREYVTSDDGQGVQTRTTLFDAGAFPKSRWAQLRMVLEYAPALTYQLFVDDVLTLSDPLTPPQNFTGMRFSLGASAAGKHSTVGVRYDDLRMTTSF